MKIDRSGFLTVILAMLVMAGFQARPGLCAIDHLESAQPLLDVSLAAGYGFSDRAGSFAKASRYGLFENGPYFSGALDYFKDKNHLSADFFRADEQDFSGKFSFDYQGLMRLDAFTQGFIHNLDHTDIVRDSIVHPVTGSNLMDFADAAPDAVYRVDVHETGVKARGKIRDFPAHVNLAYWRFEKTGSRQMRYLDENCNSCHVQSRSRTIDRVTEEVAGGIDAHLGWFDLAIEQVFRQFRDKEPVPVDSFDNHWTRAAGSYQHGDVPDSRFRSTTLKAHSSLSGGLVGALSYSLGKRENLSDLNDVSPVAAETDFHKTSGDLTYTPSERWMFTFRFRLLDLDNTGAGQIHAEGLRQSSFAGVPGAPRDILEVRDSVDIRRGEYAASAAWKPIKAITLKSDLRVEQIERSQTGPYVEGDHGVTANPVVIDPFWELPASENISSLKLSLLSRWFKNRALRVNAWYQISHSSDPAYGTSFQNRHEAFAGANWNLSPNSGLSLSSRIRDEANDRFGLVESTSGGHARFDLDRSSQSQTLNAGAWIRPTEPLLLSLNYGFARSRILQDLVFGRDASANAPLIDENTEYSQRAHSLSANSEVQILKNLQGLAEVRYIQSFARFSPRFSRTIDLGGGPVDINSDALAAISELNARQYGFSLGTTWNATEEWTCGMRYSFDRYDDREGLIEDGRAQNASLTLSRKW